MVKDLANLELRRTVKKLLHAVQNVKAEIQLFPDTRRAENVCKKIAYYLIIIQKLQTKVDINPKGFVLPHYALLAHSI